MAKFLDKAGLERLWAKTKAYVDSRIFVGGGGGDFYSTAETRIGTWIDGRPLYRKVFVYENLSAATNPAHSVESGFDNTINVLSVLAFSAGQRYVIDANYFSGSNDRFAVYYDKTSMKFGISVGTVQAPVTVYLFATYTKTTDEATRTITFAQPAQDLQMDTIDMTITPAPTSAATEILKERS